MEEEFSFPAFAADQQKLSTYPSSPFPSPLFCLLPTPPNPKSQVLQDYQRSRSFSCLEDLKLRDERNSNDEEKMDMLWEDFNEELSQISSHGKAGVDSSKLEGKKSRGVRELSCVKSVNHQRSGLVMIFNVFKKLMFVQKNRKKRTSSSLYHM
ncbi:uncharacterized protein LOC110035554 [Phalaenopsis equestris]|uniref:uncharacterized protein LOC110035554 n=1 Tax=Phalaenopsis equestris TaxID=78828 RepID=UPI0009E3DA92|nr:uncharacterized protein LOC110035554 [Phalaenopsis equestris]